MSSKGKKNRNNGGVGEVRESGAASAPSAPKTRAPRKPMGTVPERLVDKSDHIHSMVNEVLQLMLKREVPAVATNATKAFMAQVETWREAIYSVKESGWLPPEASASKDIVEGDGVRIAKDQHETYKYIFEALGVEAGAEELVAGPVTTTGRLARVLVRSKDVGTPGELDGLGQSACRPGQVFGYVSRTHLVKR